MHSTIRKRSIFVDGHNTSVSLEDGFWLALKEIAKERRSTLARTITEVDQKRTHGNLASALRVFVLNVYRSAAADSTAVPKDEASGST